MKRRPFFPLALIAPVLFSAALDNATAWTGAEGDRLFNFQLPWDDSQSTITDFSYLNEKPAGVSGRITVGPDGHLYSGNRRVRFLGVNFTHRSSFPEHADAEKIAARLAKFGVNIVRFHLMDAGWGAGGIFDPAFTDTRHLSPSALDKLDYFVAQLKQHGIYSDINLLTGRDFKAADGLDVAVESMEWKEKQTPAMFDPAMIALQKEYARQLLDRINPYTGLSYTADPAVAIVEVVNEHGLMHAWLSGLFDTLPAYYATQLREKWNAALLKTYGDHASLALKWTRSTPQGGQMLLNRDFSAQLQYWNVERHSVADAVTSVSNTGPSGKPALRIQVTSKSSQSWHIQLNQGNIDISSDKVYTLTFWARADRKKDIQVAVEQAHDPWQGLGFSKPVSLTTSWQQFRFVFSVSSSDANARLNFRNMCDELATYWFADFHLSPGGTIGLFPGENLDAGTIRLLLLNESGERTAQARNDWSRFLWETEHSYWLEMRDYLKKNLAIQAVLVGTVVGNSTPNLMAMFDMVDSHAYWQHPSFEVSWGSPWWINNSSMVGEADGGTMTGLALKRVQGKPFSVSEYNHPYPNSFGAETYYFLAAYAAFQDWDAIFAYTYADGTLNWREDRQNGYFDLHHDPAKMMSLAQAACIFRRGDIRPGKELVAAQLTSSDEVRLIPSVGPWRLVDAEHAGMSRRISSLHRTAILPDGVAAPPEAKTPTEVNLPPDLRFISDTGELAWDQAARILTVNGIASKGVVGYSMGRSIDLDGVVIRPQSSLQNWASVFLTEVRGFSLASDARRILISAFGLVQNSGLTWNHYPSNAPAGFPPPAGVNLTLGKWGTAPVQAEGIRCEFILPYPHDQVRVFALDGTGLRKSELTVTADGDRAKFGISEVDQTLWYEAVVADASTRWVIPGFSSSASNFTGIAISNPSDQAAAIRALAYDQDGGAGPFSRDVVQESLGAGEQWSKLLTEIFGLPEETRAAGWLELVSDNPLLGIFALAGNYAMTRLDGGVALQGTNKKVILGRAYQGNGQFKGVSASTTLRVCNPDELPADVRLRLFGSVGEEAPMAPLPATLLAEAERRIPAKGVLIATVEELFGRVVSGGHVEIGVLSGNGVVASEVVALPAPDAEFALSGTNETGARYLYSAQFADLEGLLFTNLRLLNRSEGTRRAILTAVGDDGDPLAAPIEILFGPGEFLEIDADRLFPDVAGSSGNSELAGFVGSLKMEVVEGDGIIGDVVFGLENLEYAAALPLQSNTFRKAVFSHVANLPGVYFTGLAVYNPGSVPTVVDLEVYSYSGSRTGQANFVLDPGRRLSDVLANLVPSTQQQVAGYIILSADQPVVAQELFGTYQQTLLSAVPPTILEP